MLRSGGYLILIALFYAREWLIFLSRDRDI